MAVTTSIQGYMSIRGLEPRQDRPHQNHEQFCSWMLGESLGIAEAENAEADVRLERPAHRIRQDKR
jgi:hypothetical protein